MLSRILLALFVTLLSVPLATAQNRTFKIDVTGGVAEPLPIAAPAFTANNPAALKIANQITEVMTANLVNTGLFREIPRAAHIATVSNFNATPAFTDWKAINAQALTTGNVIVDKGGKLTVQFRLWDVFAEAPMGEGLQFAGGEAAWRRIAHKVSDAVYTRLTGETGYFDSRVVFVSETGPKDDRKKRLAVMDQDGANLAYLTDDRSIVLAPRFSPNARDVIFTSYADGKPKVDQINLETKARRTFADLPGMSFAPRFSPDGRYVVMSVAQGSNTDIFRIDVATSVTRQLTTDPAIDTAPSFSPDGSQIVFESDRGGSQQLYIMGADGGAAKRISFGKGRYGTPVWSPRGDMIAFTKMQGGRFHIGVMRVDGSNERLLTASFLDEGPTWAPNGRVLMFFRESKGANGAPQLYSVDVSGRNLRRIDTKDHASDPAWSALLK